ncbi:MAG: serine/threonine protein kinase, partial [Chloroflexaceae bacterium]|nr:serine/threonine protein kinase [Chloroflexaceae bacterium]
MITEEQLLKVNDVIPGKHSEYLILGLVGRGGMGAVYRVRRQADNTIWALKEMRPPPNTPPDEVEENRQLFEQEAHLMGRLTHPNIPVLADFFAFDGRPVMVMEFIDGETLEDRMIESNAPLMEQQALGYGVQLCRVLHYLHTQDPPIIYRDLKPPNIMITHTSNIMKLIDFGVARTHKRGQSKDTIAMGSAGYAPPEQYGRGQTDARSDVYALGATLLHLLTNLPPVPLQTPQPGAIRRMNPTVSDDTERVIIKAMNLEREKRYQSCAEMEQQLLRCLDTPYVDPTANVSVPPPVPVQSLPVRSRSDRAGLVGADGARMRDRSTSDIWA